MKINLKTIKYYFLTCNNEIRRNHMLNEFKDYDITEVNPVMSIIGKNKSAPSGFSRILDLASRNQDRTKPFQPFCMFEDDVKKYRDFPETIEIPDNSDILYIGLSSEGCDNTGVNKLSYIDINKDFIKINNMLGLHGIIICSSNSLLAIQKCMLEGYFEDKPWDIFTAQIQPYYNVYALKIPLVYQYGVIGGVESHTKIELINNDTILMDQELINKTNVSNITCYSKDINLLNKSKIENNIYLYWVGYEYKLIKKLRELMYMHSNDSFKINLITRDNLKDYLNDIPPYFDSLKPAHQADYVRVCVICERGGIWLDSDTIVMDNLSSLFEIFNNYDAFFVNENNNMLCNGVFGSKANTLIMIEWKKQMIEILNNEKVDIEWSEIGGILLDKIYKNIKNNCNYKILNGLENVYPISWQTIFNDFFEKPYENYKNICREYQPLIILCNSIYRSYDLLNDIEISKLPITYFVNKSKENYENKIQNTFYNYFIIANNNYNSKKYEEAILNYKRVLIKSNLNDEKYISCLKIYKSFHNLCKEQDGIYYLVESIKYDKKRIECIYILITYYNIMGLPEVAFSFYSIIRDYYENQFIEDYSNVIKKLDVDTDKYIFFLPYFMIIVGTKLNKPEIAIKMFQIIFNFKYINSGEWWLNNLLHNLNLYIKDIKKNKRKFYYDCKNYLNLIKDIPNINKSIIDSLLIIIEEYNNKEILIRYPIKIINLKRRTDRKEKLLKYFIKENVENYEFVEACDAYKLETTKEIKELFKGNNFRYSKGVIGCAYSHMNLWKKLLEDKNNDFYIIFEDDAELTENFNKKLDICCEEFINNNMEILYLGAHSYIKRNTDINNLEIIYKNYQTEADGNGLWAYIISKQAAFKIINYINKNGIKYAIDSRYYINNLSSINYLNETIVGTYFSFADSDIQKHNEQFSFN